MKLNESCHAKTKLPHLASETARTLYYYAEWVGHFTCRPDFYVKRENWESYLLLYTLHGSGVLRYKGQHYEIGPHTLLFLDCRVPHEYFPSGDGWEFKFIHFAGQASRAYCEHIFRLYASPVVGNMRETERYFDSVYELVRTGADEARSSDMIYRILTKLILHATESGDRSRMQEVLTYIAENYAAALTVSELAALSHMSRSHFQVAFKRHFGFSPYGYLLEYRIRIAKLLLQESDDAVEAIGAKCGFSDASSFIRTFKRCEGVTPLAYRRNGEKP